MRSPLLLRSAALAVLLVVPRAPQERQLRFDLVIAGGLVVDGSGGAPYAADVGITSGRITAVGRVAPGEAKETVDATGLVVSPGFINLHSHADPQALASAENMLTQGVTTEILNADGGGPVNISEQLTRLSSGALAVNVGVAIGFNAVWQHVIGAADKRPGANDIAAMQELIAKGLEAGAYAVSAGLDYKPAYFATEDEVVHVLEVARKWRTNFPNHDRVLPSTGYSARAAVRETMRIAERSGLAAVITHMKVSGAERGTADVVLGEMAAATARGSFTAADVYPYLSGMTSLHALLVPGWAQDGGVVAMRKRFADAELRPRIIREVNETMAGRFTGPDGVLVLSSNRTLSSYMKEFRTDSPGEAIVRILEKELPRAILGFGDERDLVRIMQHPTSAISCDCGASTGPTGHPRNAGTFPRVLGKYVREERALSLTEAIRKMTALPAQMVGILDRGYVAVGMHADITVFDPEKVIDRATFEEPGALSEGIRHVIINGTRAVTDGRVTGATGGSVLRRRTWEPSRAMNHQTERSIVLSGEAVKLSADDASPVTLNIAVSQWPDAKRATGRIRVVDRDQRILFESSELGVLQSTTGWASVSGLTRTSVALAPVAFTMTVDQGDPVVGDARNVVTVEVAGSPPIRWVVH